MLQTLSNFDQTHFSNIKKVKSISNFITKVYKANLFLQTKVSGN